LPRKKGKRAFLDLAQLTSRVFGQTTGMSRPDLLACDKRIEELEARLAAAKTGAAGVLNTRELLELMEETLAEWRRRRKNLVESAGKPHETG
jgi:hypothetical protein